MTTRSRGSDDGREYGLGLEPRPLPCGGRYWSHGGDIFGYQTAGGATADGRQATVMTNVDPGGTDAQDDDMEAAVQTGLYGGNPHTPSSGPAPLSAASALPIVLLGRARGVVPGMKRTGLL